MKKIYTIVALLTLCFCVATGLTGCKKTSGEELNNLAMSDIFELSTPGDKYYYTNEEINAMSSEEGYSNDNIRVTNLKAKQDVTIKSISLSVSFLYDVEEAWVKIRKYQTDTSILETEKIKNISKNTFYNFSMVSEEGITIKKGTKFHLHISYTTSENTDGITVANSIKNLKFTFI